MSGGSVGVAVNKTRDSMLSKLIDDRISIDIHDHFILGCGRATAAKAHERRNHSAHEIRPRQHATPACGVLPVGAKALILDIIGTQQVPVHEQGARPLDVMDDPIGQQRCPGGSREALTQEKVAVASLHE